MKEDRTAPSAVAAVTSFSPEVEAELAAVATGAGCELIHAEWKGGVLRLFLDRPAPAPAAAPASAAAAEAGVSLADCEQVAKQASALLDVMGFGNGSYLLEVSSPGLDRQLYRPADYRRFLGRLTRVTYETEAAPVAGAAGAGARRRRTVVARLAEAHPAAPAKVGGPEIPAAASGVESEEIEEIVLVDDRTGERTTLRLADVRQARLEVEL